MEANTLMIDSDADRSIDRSNPASSGQPPAPGTRGVCRLGDLVASRRNVRTAARAPESVRAMAQSIHVYGGVLQNLLVHADRDEDGRWTGRLGVSAGETRRQALCLLRDGGVAGASGFDDDTPVPFLMIEEPHAVAASLTENATRTDLHPADEFEAFKVLVDACGDIEQVAAVYGVTPAVVERRLRLANAAPPLFRLYRRGGMTLDQLMALCITEDHAKQVRTWKAARSEWEREPRRLRMQMTMGQVNMTSDPVGIFVGMEAYEAAGGAVLRDLFAEVTEGFAADAELLHRLAASKLDAVAEEVRGEGWSWVEARTSLDYSERHAFEQCPVKKNRVAAASAPFAGTVVCLDRAGRVEVHRGLVRPDARKAHAKALRQAQAAQDAGGKAVAGGGGAVAIADGAAEESVCVSRPLSLRLGAQRTAALQVMLARNTSLSLACLAHTLVGDVLRFGHGGGHDPLQVHARPALGPAAGDEDLRGSTATGIVQGLLDGWRERLPEERDALLPWLIALPSDQLLDLIGVCVAASVTTVPSQAAEAEVLSGHALDVARAAGLDMTDFWEPTAASYLASVPKAHALAVAREVAGDAACAGLEKTSKGELVTKVAELLQGKRWLPALLRVTDDGATRSR